MTKAMKILWVKSGPLYPLNTGGRLRTCSMLMELSRSHEITYLALLPEGRELHPDEPEASYAREKIWIPSREPRKDSFEFFAGLAKNLLFSNLPVVLDRYHNRALEEKLVRMDKAGNFDVIVCDFLTPAPNFDFARVKTPAVLFQHNVEAQIWKRLAREKADPVRRWYFESQFRRLRDHEARLSAKFAGVIAVSAGDAEHFRQDYGLDNVLGAVPTGVDTGFFCPPSRRRPAEGLIGFLGSMDWMPNIECVQFFAREIFSKIRERRPDSRFRIIGRDPTPAVRRLAEEHTGIEVTGTVDDVRSHLDDCEVLVVPLRSGGGTRIKIFEAMAQGVPVVSTTIGAEGLPVEDGETILIADEPESFAAAVTRILDSPGFGAELSRRARNLLVENHSWKVVAEEFTRLCETVRQGDH